MPGGVPAYTCMHGKLKSPGKYCSCYSGTTGLGGLQRKDRKKWSNQPQGLKATCLACFLARMAPAVPTSFWTVVLCLYQLFLVFIFFSNSISEQECEIFHLSVNACCWSVVSRAASAVVLCTFEGSLCRVTVGQQTGNPRGKLHKGFPNLTIKC